MSGAGEAEAAVAAVAETLDRQIAQSTEFVCERWGQGEEAVERYAPLTRGADGKIWIHPGWARDCARAEIAARATRIWEVSGSFWNAGAFRLVYRAGRPVRGGMGDRGSGEKGPPRRRAPMAPERG